MNQELIYVLLGSLIIGIIIVEYGAFRTKKSMKNELSNFASNFPKLLDQYLKEVEDHPEKHPRLAKAYKLYLRLCDVAENVLDEMEKEVQKQREETKK